MNIYTHDALTTSSATHPHFGEHLTIDAYRCNSKLLDEKSIVLGALDCLPEHLGMKKLSEPHVHFAEGTGPKDPGGWSGYVIIEESHISIHTFPFFEFASIDVYTCQNGLDIPKIKTFFKKAFDIGIFEENFIVRGKRFLELAQRPIPEASKICDDCGDCNACRV